MIQPCCLVDFPSYVVKLSGEVATQSMKRFKDLPHCRMWRNSFKPKLKRAISVTFTTAVMDLPDRISWSHWLICSTRFPTTPFKDDCNRHSPVSASSRENFRLDNPMWSRFLENIYKTIKYFFLFDPARVFWTLKKQKLSRKVESLAAY